MDPPQQNVPQSPAVGQSHSNSTQKLVSITISHAPPAYVAQGQNISDCDPCCGCLPLSAGCVVIGLLGIALNILLIIVLALLYYLAPGPQSDDVNNAIIALIVILIIYIVFDILLVGGAATESSCACMIWLFATVFGLTFRLTYGVLTGHYEVLILLIEIYFIAVVVYYVKELNGKRPQGQAQAFIPPTQVPSMIQPTGAYGNPNVGPPPPYSQTQSAALLQQNPAGPGQTYPSPGFPGQSY